MSASLQKNDLTSLSSGMGLVTDDGCATVHFTKVIERKRRRGFNIFTHPNITKAKKIKKNNVISPKTKQNDNKVLEFTFLSKDKIEM